MKQSEKGLTAVIISRSSGRTKRRLTGAYHVVSYTLVLMVVAALTGGCGDGGGLSGFAETPFLPEFDAQGRYDPYYSTGELNDPRYLHEVLTLDDGRILVVGGSDENGFSSLDTVEVYDQSLLLADQAPPQSGVGSFVSTDFEGNPIILELARTYHNVTLIPDGRVLISGGAANLATSTPFEQSEIFDPLTRTLEGVEDGMINPRMRHQIIVPPTGEIIIAGGQVLSSFTEQDNFNNGGNVQGGGGQNQQVQVLTFPSTPKVEVFVPGEDTFLGFTVGDSNVDIELTTRRGRSGHTTVRLAGPDNSLNSGDDLYLMVGGFQTLSGENAPRDRFPGQTGVGAQNALRELEFYDPLTGVFSRVPGYSLVGPRINFPLAFNLGEFNQETIDGVQGMGNCILIMNGETDEWPNRISAATFVEEVAIATYSGFGPAQGLALFRQTSTLNTHIQGIEGDIASDGFLDGFFEDFTPPGRCRTSGVSFPRALETGFIETSVYTVGGVSLWNCDGQCSYELGTIAAGVIFDPFYSLEAVLDFEASSRDLTIARLDQRNPLGVVGCFFAMDGAVPADGALGFGDTLLGGWPTMESIVRHWGKITMVAGPDGVLNSQDDRALLVGGGSEWGTNAVGGDPSAPSAEIVIMPGRGVDPNQ